MLKIKDLQPGEKLSVTQYLTVDSVSTDSIVATNRDGQVITFRGKEMIEAMHSGAQYNETKKVGKHDLATKLQTAGDKVFTVSFNKINGEERILTGHYKSSEPNLGRTNVIDLNVSADDKSKGIRLVDNREINWIVLDCIKYTS